jgi:hypothetical protein
MTFHCDLKYGNNVIQSESYPVTHENIIYFENTVKYLLSSTICIP